jgi:type I restriction enzyme S subunit
MRLAKEIAVGETTCDASFNQDVKAIECGPNIVPRFMLYWLLCQSGELLASADEAAHGTKRIQTAQFLESTILLPPLSSQERIADILSAYDDLIENNKRRMALLEESVHLLYREWFVHLRFPGREHVRVVDGLPDGWRRIRLDEHAPFKYGKSLPSELRRPGAVPVFGSSGIVGNHDEAGVLTPGLIVGRKGNVGSVFRAPTPFFAIDTVYYIDGPVADEFMFQTLRSMPFQNSDAAVPGLSRTAAHSIEFVLPESATRRNFDDFARPTVDLIHVIDRGNTALTAARDALLPKLMSGALPV